MTRFLMIQIPRGKYLLLHALPFLLAVFLYLLILSPLDMGTLAIAGLASPKEPCSFIFSLRMPLYVERSFYEGPQEISGQLLPDGKCALQVSKMR